MICAPADFGPERFCARADFNSLAGIIFMAERFFSI
jgi:hypothetical protein